MLPGLWCDQRHVWDVQTAAARPRVLCDGQPLEQTRDIAADERDAQTFTDTDFYSQLLQEFLAGRTSSTAAFAPALTRVRTLGCTCPSYWCCLAGVWLQGLLSLFGGACGFLHTAQAASCFQTDFQSSN